MGDDTSGELGIKCSAFDDQIAAMCAGLSPVAAVEEAIKATSKLIQADAKKLVDGNVSDAPWQKAKWNKLNMEEQSALNVGQADLKESLDSELKAKSALSEVESNAQMAKKMREAVASTKNKYGDYVDEKVKKAEASQEDTEKELKDKADDILDNAIEKAEKVNEEKKKQDQLVMEKKIDAMTTQVTNKINSVTDAKIAKIKSDSMKVWKKNLADELAKQKVETHDFLVKVTQEEEEKASKKEADVRLTEEKEAQKEIDEFKKQTYDNLKYLISEYKKGLTEDELEKKTKELENRAEMKIAVFKRKHEAQKNLAIRAKLASLDLMQEANRNVQQATADKKMENEDHIQSMKTEWLSDTESKVKTAQKEGKKNHRRAGGEG